MIKKLELGIKERITLFSDLNNDLFSAIELAILEIKKSLKQKNKILIYGNGGSATQSSHFAAELVNRFYNERPAINTIALTTDTANLTSIANDYNFDSIFSRQIEALGNKNDISFGITTSGKSENVLKALKISKQNGLKTIALCGANKEQLKNIQTDIIIGVETTDTPKIQEIHLFILHFIAEQLEEIMFNGIGD